MMSQNSSTLSMMPAAGRYDEDVAHDFDTDSDGNSDE